MDVFYVVRFVVSLRYHKPTNSKAATYGGVSIFMKHIIIIFITFLVSACVSTNLLDDATILSSEDFEVLSLNGTFSNTGATKGGFKGPRLSEFLFPKFEYHKLIDSISVSTQGENVKLSGISKSRIIIEKTYQNGKDFYIKEGAISLGTDLSCGECSSPGAVHLGLVSHSYKLLFTDNGDAILRKTDAGAFVVLFVIPFAGVDKTDFIYRKY